MKGIILAVSLSALTGFCVQAQQVFKGKITYKSTFSGDEKLIEQGKLFLGTHTEVVTNGKKFRYYTEGGMGNKEAMFEAGKKTVYEVDAKAETITKKFLRKKYTYDRKVTLKKTGKIKVIAGMKAYQVELYRRDTKQVTVWLSDEYVWNLKDHPYKVRGLLLEGSTKDLDNRVILKLEFPHPSKKASFTLTAQEVDTNVPKNAFKLPPFKMVDDTKTKDKPIKLDDGR